MIKAGIVGGTGYTGVELLRILSGHPGVEIRVVTSRNEVGVKVSDLYPNLRGRLDMEFKAPEIETLAGCDVVFFATPNGASMRMARELLSLGIKIIDLAADFRLRDPVEWEKWYGEPHACPELLKEAVYGLSEVNRAAICDARLIACPGCYPTAVQLGFLPLVESNAICVSNLIADVKSGVSGAGRKARLTSLMAESGESLKAYSVSGHRHLPEIIQGLEESAGDKIGLTFVPHLVPMIRGIHATLYARLTATGYDLQELFEKRFQSEQFVDVLPRGSHPDTRNVKGCNRCQIAVHQPRHGDIVVILVVIDNLVKGAAGQAVQNMNLMYRLDEATGLDTIGLYP
ncbi:MAG: N-acetyl-gamma-glutamyl-phosphate reductase [Methylococcales bacterium]